MQRRAQDGYPLRGLAKSPAFTAVAMLMLASDDANTPVFNLPGGL
jgi:hypothetical protein